ncbi:hypothetical protein ABZ883_17490 [Streptomyces sp. NPDC046977]|uniref:hypothetical protein n=1 Tax=Streptomyces sp. NPDC046977 TaxID=3154703 RepID=UPI0033D62828
MRTVLWALAALFFGALAVSAVVGIITGFRSGLGGVAVDAGHVIVSGLATGWAVGKAREGRAARNR